MNWALNRLLVQAQFGIDPLDMTWVRFMACLKFRNIAGKILNSKGITPADQNMLDMQTKTETL